MALKSRNISKLFPIQALALKPILDGANCVVRARTGSGKSLAFAIPLVEKLLRLQQQGGGGGIKHVPRALILAPTRELAMQLDRDFQSLTDPSGRLRCTCIYGGAESWPQKQALRRGMDIVVGTPGRVLDMIERRELYLGNVGIVVLDEADQMLDMGFKDDINKVLEQKGAQKIQLLLFSATMPGWVQSVIETHMDKVHETECGRESRVADLKQVMESRALHGDIAQENREATLRGFREGKFRVLIATDVAARGLDIPDVEVVIQTCPPDSHEQYVHRCGRTARAGTNGTSILCYKAAEESMVWRIEKKAGISFKRVGAPQQVDGPAERIHHALIFSH
eukprot:jgi/Bigna1/44509/e_gw1.97.7.1